MFSSGLVYLILICCSFLSVGRSVGPMGFWGSSMCSAISVFVEGSK